jgi:polyphosphate kinase
MYFDRELSWLAFNQRVLAEAENGQVPLLERCKFLAIVTGNLDEFFMIRVAGLKKQLDAGLESPSVAGFTTKQLLQRISQLVREMTDRQFKCYSEQLVPGLAVQGVEIVGAADLDEQERAKSHHFYEEVLYPILTPMAVDPSHPLPTLTNNALYLAVRMAVEHSRGLRGARLGVIQVPQVVGRYFELREPGRVRLLPMEQLVEMHLAELFAGHRILSVHPFRLTRDTDLDLDEEAGEDLLSVMEQGLANLPQQAAVRLNVAADMDDELLAMLWEHLDLSEDDLYRVQGPLDLKALWSLRDLAGFDSLRDPPAPPIRLAQLPKGEEMYEAIAQADIVLHHPYDSFEPVIDLVRTAAEDPAVLAIKQTLYRTSGQSPVIDALKRAAINGKHVTVLVELRARLDEERNIRWARQLEQVGADVIYGLVGLKTHCKALLIVRQEEKGVQRYVHLSTGNYNDATARLYTDIGIFTARKALAEDVSGLFNVITGYSVPPRWNLIEIAPTGLRRRMLHMIRREIELHSPATPGFIRAKVNAVTDAEIIDALYEASRAGVKIELLVRGICCLRPLVEGLSENITVRSVVGRYLEHSRIYHFHAGGREQVYISSADWMERNLDRRIESLVPVIDPQVRQRVLEILEAGLADNVKSWSLLSDGRYERYENGEPPFDSQKELYLRASRIAQQQTQAAPTPEEILKKARRRRKDAPTPRRRKGREAQ